MLSMTGFGKARSESDDLTVEIEIRTVNNRFLKCQIKCPSHLRELEPIIDAALRKSLHRGSVTVMLRVTQKEQGTDLSLDADLARSLIGQVNTLASDLNQPAPTLSDILRLPGVVTATEANRDLIDAHKDLILATMNTALKDLVSMREAEGRAPETDLAAHTATLRGGVESMAERAPLMVPAYAEKLSARLQDRLKELGESMTVTPGDIVREIALFTDRSDISEEIQRLQGHLDQFEKTLASAGEVGRRLDFLVQEIHREINTIGSKAQDAAISESVVESKTCAEKLREQVQNAE